MSKRYVGALISSTAATSNTTYASGVWTLKQYKVQLEAGNWPLVPYYSFSNSNPTSLNEGANTTFSVNTTNVLTGTQLYWSILHNTSNSSDFIYTSNTFTVTNNVASFTVGTVADLSTEGTEYFQLQVQKTDANGEVLVTSPSITLSDTSVTPPPPIDVTVVGGGGGQLYTWQLSGGGGGGAVLISSNFSGIVLGTTYTVSVGGGSYATGTQSTVTGSFSVPGVSLIASGGGAGGYSSTSTSGGNPGASGGSGGGGLCIYTTARVSTTTRAYVSAYGAGPAGGISDTWSSSYPGKFTYYQSSGLGATAIGNGFNITGVSGQTVGAGGGGGGAAGTASGYPVPNSGYVIFINGGNGVLSSFNNTYYGGGGASKAIQWRSGTLYNYSGSAGLGGGGGANSGGGGTGGYQSTSGGSGVVMFKYETSVISTTTTGTVVTTTNGLYTIKRFTGSGTISFNRI